MCAVSDKYWLPITHPLTPQLNTISRSTFGNFQFAERHLREKLVLVRFQCSRNGTGKRSTIEHNWVSWRLKCKRNFSRVWFLYSPRSLFNTRNYEDVTEQEYSALFPCRLPGEHRDHVEEKERSVSGYEVSYSLDDELQFPQRRLSLSILKSLALFAIQLYQYIVN